MHSASVKTELNKTISEIVAELSRDVLENKLFTLVNAYA